MCIYNTTEVLLNLSPSALEFYFIVYFILYVCHLMVNENNPYCFKWSSIQLLLDCKSVLSFSLFFYPLSYNVTTNFREVKCQLILRNLCSFVPPKGLPWKKKSKLNRSNSVLCCRGTSCDLRDSNRRNPSSNSQCQITLGINEYKLENSAFQQQLKPKYFWGPRRWES